MADIIDFEDVDMPGALRIYNGHRMNFVLFFNRADALHTSLEAAYTAALSTEIEKVLEKAEVQLAKCNQVASYLTQRNHARSAALTAEVDTSKTELQALWTAHYTRTQVRAAGQQAAAAAPAPARVRPIEGLKPQKLSHDASTGDFTLWKRQFRAYYTTSNMQATNIANQQAYFLNCVDLELAKLVSRDTAAMDPVFGPAPSLHSKLEAFFLRKHPPLLRRQSFFQMRQQAGQGARDYLEALRSAADEADLAAMRMEDALCVQLVSGLNDMKLVEKLTEIEQPTLQRFITLVDAHMHAQASSTAVGAAAQTGRGNRNRGNSTQQQPQQGGSRQRGQQPVNEDEKKRRQALQGKCYRCGSADHQGRDCKHQRDVTCNKCRKPGHVSPACWQTLQQRQARQVTAEDPYAGMPVLPPQRTAAAPYYYMPPDYASQAGSHAPSANANAVTAVTASQPTPKCNL